MLWSTTAKTTTMTATTTAKPGCPQKCGNITVTYPFGIGEGCYIAKGNDINCNTSFNPPKPFIGTGNIEVEETSLTQALIKSTVAYSCYAETGALISMSSAWINLAKIILVVMLFWLIKIVTHLKCLISLRLTFFIKLETFLWFCIGL